MVISFCPKRMKSKKWGRGREREREGEKERERERKRETARGKNHRQTYDSGCCIGSILYMHATVRMLLPLFPARPALKARISHVIVSTSKRPEFVHCVLLLWYIISGDATSMNRPLDRRGGSTMCVCIHAINSGLSLLDSVVV